MSNEATRYRQMERYILYTLLANCVLFYLYWISAASGIGWAKAITAVLTIILSLLCLTILILTREFKRKRSLWMSVLASATVVCLLLSLILHFPCPKPVSSIDKTATISQINEY